MFGETFLAKRHAAGREEGRVEERSELLKFIEENPDITTEQVKEWLRDGVARRNGDGGGKERRD